MRRIRGAGPRRSVERTASDIELAVGFEPTT